MIKELFASCLLSASVATSGLNVQTRDTNDSNVGWHGTIRTELPSQGDGYAIWNVENIYENQSTKYLGYYLTSPLNPRETEKGNIQLSKKGYCMKHNIIGKGDNIDNEQEIYMFKIDLFENVTKFKINVDMIWNFTENTGNSYIYSTTDSKVYNDYLDLNINSNTQIASFTNNFFLGKANYKYNLVASSINNNIMYPNEIEPMLTPGKTNYLFIINSFYSNSEQYTNGLEEQNITATTNQADLKGYMATNFTPLNTASFNIWYNTNPQYQEIIDIPGLMFTVLTMPFTFISTAFDLTLFPGTPYQLNISMLFMAIIGVMIFAWILSMIVKHK